MALFVARRVGTPLMGFLWGMAWKALQPPEPSVLGWVAFGAGFVYGLAFIVYFGVFHCARKDGTARPSPSRGEQAC